MPASLINRSKPVIQAHVSPRKSRPQPASANMSQVNPYGIEVVRSLVWQGWEPGREYTKLVILKNVNVKTQKIKYIVPSTRFFTTLYPKPVVLSAGTSFSLPITFRPLEKLSYQDKVEFHTKDGSFDVTIKAILPQIEIDVIEDLNFNMCAAKDTVEADIEVSNTGDLETVVNWNVGLPFCIEPWESTIKPGMSFSFKATFKPLTATVHEANAVCCYGPSRFQTKITKLHGIGKYPHIIVSNPGQFATAIDKESLEAVVQFDVTEVGCTVQKWVELHNLSSVRAPFKVEHPSKIGRIDTVFYCLQKTGVVPPISSVKIPIVYNPNTVDTTSIDYFHVVAIGNVSKSVIKCNGSSKGPIIQLSSRVVNFKQIDIGDIATRTIDIYNGSDVEAVYQFIIDCKESVFKFDRVSGVLKPETQQTIILRFQPSHPINYHRRVTCMVHNQGPLFLDLLGTCHSELIKPAVLLPIHLERYKCHVERGLSLFPPEQLNEMLRRGKLELDDAGALMVLESESVDPIIQPLPQVPPMEEYFNDGFHCDVVNFVPHVSLDTNVADFGNCQNLRIIEDKIINVTNHTHGKIKVQWIGDTNRTYSVMPATMDIPPLKSGTFSVSFKPNAPNQFYGADLECYIYYKSLRDFRLVEDTTHCPPWCLILACTGHTFMPNNETFLPRYNLDSPQIVFPAVNSKEATYRTVLMRNTGTTPIMAEIQKDLSNTYSVKPAMCLLKGEHQIFVVKIAPTSVQTYKQKLTMRLNDNDKYDQVLEVVGSAESPEVLLDTDGVMVFKPTCIGMASHRSYTIKNISRIPLRFEWKLKYADRNLLTVRPESGIIQPNENQCQVWSFIPRTSEKCVMKPCLIVWGQGFSSTSSGGKKKQFTVQAIGEGSVGDIKVDKDYIDFGDIVVGSSDNQHISIFNNSTCSLQYKLLIEQTLDSPYAVEFKEDNIALELERTEGILPARSKHTLMATVRPLRRVNYQFAISYQLITPEAGDRTSGPLQEPQHLCHILTTGVFPTMAVTDARCYGSAIGISKKQLWDLFSLDNFNVCLDSDPSTAELMYSVATRHSHCRRPPVYTRAVLDVNFSAAPVGSEPCIVNLMFENTGTVPTDWAFLFPSDLQLELEYWAETGEFDEDELHEMKVMDNQLFSIEPKKGQLQPGECRTVTFTYRHTMAGTDRLPVLLKLARGRELLLNFVGVTVNMERRYIHFPSNKHMFTPVPVGEKISPKQMYELYNGGALPVKFEFDLTPLELLRQENFDQPIFECLNPVGEIMPGRSVAVEWRFSPVEAKTYMVDVPIHVYSGDTAIVTFTGVGYDKRVLGDTMPITDQHDISGVPGVQSVPIPGQLLYLSQERLSFGNMPLFCRARRMVFLTNMSRQKDVSFEWHVTTQLDSKYLFISPVRGRLTPGETKMCRVVFVAYGVPSFYDLDLVCEVTDETEMSEFRERLTEWKDEQHRQEYEFTITEHDIDADKRIPNLVEVTDRPRSGRLQSLEDPKTVMSDGELTKYKTLPPIRQLSIDEKIAFEKKEKKKAEDLWEKPAHPTPFLLHLGLTARTHDINDFQANFSEEYRSFYIDRLLSEKSSKKEQMVAEPPEEICCTRAEADVLAGVLNNVIRGLLDDTYFHEALRKVGREPIPYFCQIRDTPLASHEPSVAGDQGPASPLARSITSADRASERSSAVSSSKGDEPLFDEIDTKLTPRHTREEMKRARSAEAKLLHRRGLKKLPEFGNSSESLLENTVLNIISEALAGEFSITARPRFIALPKRPTSTQSKNSKS